MLLRTFCFLKNQFVSTLGQELPASQVSIDTCFHQLGRSCSQPTAASPFSFYGTVCGIGRSDTDTRACIHAYNHTPMPINVISLNTEAQSLGTEDRLCCRMTGKRQLITTMTMFSDSEYIRFPRMTEIPSEMAFWPTITQLPPDVTVPWSIMSHISSCLKKQKYLFYKSFSNTCFKTWTPLVLPCFSKFSTSSQKNPLFTNMQLLLIQIIL